ncbi:MAG: amidohydrolase family protein [Acutalibacteraceae bacterium]
MQTNKKVDFHSHYLSKTYYEYLEKYEGPKPDNFETPKWNIKSHLKQMETLGIAFSFLSVSSPNLSKADRETQKAMVRQINLEGKAYVDAYPNKLGLFASLPLPNVEDAIEEAMFAVNELKADGFGLSTHYAGVYLGDPKYDKLMEYLNSIGAVIAVHPVEPSAVPAGMNTDVPIPAMEFFMDTTRTFMYMVMNNLFERFPKIKWIFPHAGAFLCILSDRINGFAVLMKQEHPDIPLDFKGDMNHVYFDVAGFTLQKQLSALLKDVNVKNLLYGSDVPYTPNIACVAHSGGLEQFPQLTKKEKDMMFFENAVNLVPRIANIVGVPVKGQTVCYADTSLNTHEKVSRAARKTVAKAYSIIFA